MVLYAQSIAQEEFYSTSLAPHQRNKVALRLAQSKTDVVVRGSFYPHTIPTLIQQLEISFGIHSSFYEQGSQDRFSMYHSRNGLSCVSLARSTNCYKTIILHPVHGVVSLYVSIWVKTCLAARRNIVRSDSV